MDVETIEPCHKKSAFCICENKDADRLRGKCTADLCLCFCYLVQSLYLQNPKSSSAAVQPGLCRTFSETLKKGFLVMQLIYNISSVDVGTIYILNINYNCNNFPQNKLVFLYIIQHIIVSPEMIEKLLKRA